jgi:putative FmdB family regulatory protein
MSPVYQYQCPVCKVVDERIQTMDAPLTPRCEKCGCWMLRVISAPAVVYKGEGWAKKDRGGRK